MLDSYILYKKKLEGDYKETFKKIELYGTTSHIDEQTREELMSTLLDIFLEAQEEGRPVEKITGKNVERFCKNFYSGCGFKEQLISCLEPISWYIWVFFVLTTLDIAIYLCDFWERTAPSFFALKTNFDFCGIGLFLLSVYLIQTIAGFIVRKILFKRKKIMKNLVLFVRIFTVLIIVILIFVPSNLTPTSVPTWIGYVISGGLILLYEYAAAERHRKNLESQVKPMDYPQTQNNDLSSLEFIKTCYRKRNQRRLKRNKAPLTKEEYITRELKNLKRQQSPIFCFIILFVFLIPVVTWMFFTNPFESGLDIFAFVSIFLLLEPLIISFFGKLTRKTNASTIVLLECELSNPTPWDE